MGGALLLYFTNSLYEPPLSKFAQPVKLDPSDAKGDSSAVDQKLPLLRPLCVRVRGAHRSVAPSRKTSLDAPACVARSLADDPSLEVVDQPFVPPRFEPRRLVERVLANVGAVCIWTVRGCAAARARVRTLSRTRTASRTRGCGIRWT